MVHAWTAVSSMARFFITFALAAEAVAVVATGPCDIFNATGTPCVAAHSTVRALFGNYVARCTRWSDLQIKPRRTSA